MESVVEVPLRYIKKKLKNKWPLGSRIDSVSKIAKDTNSSQYAVRQALDVLNTVLLNQGHGGIWVIGKIGITLSKTMQTLRHIDNSVNYLKAVRLMASGGIYDRATGYILCRKEDFVIVFSHFTKKLQKFPLTSILNMINGPIKVEELLIDRSEEMVHKYVEQVKLSEVIDVIIKYKSLTKI